MLGLLRQGLIIYKLTDVHRTWPGLASVLIFVFLYGLKVPCLGSSPSRLTSLTTGISDSIQVNPRKSDSSQLPDSNYILEYLAHPILQTITWPIEKALLPLVELASSPLQPPIRYFAEEDVVDRVIDIVSYGPQRKIQIYPTLALSVGQGSKMGLTLRANNILPKQTDNLFLGYIVYVDGAQTLRFRYNTSNILGKNFNNRLVAYLRMSDNVRLAHPGSSYTGYISDTSKGIDNDVSWGFYKNQSLGFGVRWRRSDLKQTNRPNNQVQCGQGYFFTGPNEECLAKRGINQNLDYWVFQFKVSSNTVDNPNIPTQGSKQELGFSYVYGEKDHSYMEWGGLFQNYLFLGIQRYEISREEQKKLGALNYKKIKKALNYSNIKSQLFNRKVIVTQLRASQVLDVPGQNMPAQALRSISNTTPMRGYGGSPFRGKALGAVSAEYRMPLMHMLEGTLFNEYAVLGPSLHRLSHHDVKNSWGFGIQVARKDIYLFRAQAGFHGLSYPLFNLTVDGVY